MVASALDEGADVGYHDKNRWNATALHLAGRANHLSVVNLLLERKAPTEARCGDGETALHWCAYWGRLEVVKALVEAGARLDCQNVKGRTALGWAKNREGLKFSLVSERCEEGRAAVVEYLQEKMDSAEVTAEIEKTRALAQTLQISGTPTFVMQDELLRGYLPYDQMKAILEEKRG